MRMIQRFLVLLAAVALVMAPFQVRAAVVLSAQIQSLAPSSIQSGGTATVAVKVVDASTSAPYKGGQVSATVRNGSTVVWSTGPGSIITTDAAGQASVVIGPISSAGTLAVGIDVVGPSNTASASSTLTVTGSTPTPSGTSTSGTTSGTGASSSTASTSLGVTIPNPIKCADATCLITQIIRYILGTIAIIATLMFVWGGILMLTSAGNEKRVEQAKETLAWAAIGVVVILLSWTLIKFVLGALIK